MLLPGLGPVALEAEEDLGPGGGWLWNVKELEEGIDDEDSGMSVPDDVLMEPGLVEYEE